MELTEVSMSRKIYYLPFTFKKAMLEVVPYLLLAVHVNMPESSEKTSAITKVHISSVE